MAVEERRLPEAGNKSEMELLGQIYEIVRLVDPAGKTVQRVIKPESAVQSGDRPTGCYHFWQTGEVCSNCISQRAMNENGSFVKLEYFNDTVFLITALPVNLNGTPVVLELLKDVTDAHMIAVEGKEEGALQDIIRRRNQQAVHDEVTGHYNRRYFFERLPFELRTSAEYQARIAIFLVEIANLKMIRDTYGLTAGDRINRTAADILADYAVPEGWLARIGDGEYVLVRRFADRDEAGRLWLHLHESLRTVTADADGHSVTIRLHTGYSLAESGEETAGGLLEKARCHLIAAQKLDKKTARDDRFAMKYGMTAREIEVAALLTEGLANEEIAGRLYVGLSTVKKHLSSIYQKAGVKSRAEFLSVCAAENAGYQE